MFLIISCFTSWEEFFSLEFLLLFMWWYIQQNCVFAVERRLECSRSSDQPRTKIISGANNHKWESGTASFLIIVRCYFSLLEPEFSFVKAQKKNAFITEKMFLLSESVSHYSQRISSLKKKRRSRKHLATHWIQIGKIKIFSNQLGWVQMSLDPLMCFYEFGNF